MTTSTAMWKCKACGTIQAAEITKDKDGEPVINLPDGWTTTEPDGVGWARARCNTCGVS